MGPYRQPREPEKPPKDAMRPVLIIAGVVAGLIAVVAITVAASERLTPKRAPYEVVAKSSSPTPPVDAPPSAIAEAPRDAGEPVRSALPEGPMSFSAHASSCFGDCAPHTTEIDAKGNVTLSMGAGLHGGGCQPSHTKTLSAADLAALTARARSLHIERMQKNYVHMTDVQRYTTTVEAGGVRYDVTHLHVKDAPDASGARHDEAAIDALYREIERLGGIEAWMKTCKHRGDHADPRVNPRL